MLSRTPVDLSRAPVDVGAVVARARRLLLGLYLLLGFTVSSWLSRMPTVRDSLDLSTGQLGTLLLVGAFGSLCTVLVAGAVATRWGSRRTLLVAAVVFSVASLLLGLGPTVGSVPVLLAGIVLMSASFAMGNVPLNVESVVIERRMGRTVVPQFHAAFSVGAVVGSGFGALCSWAGIPLLAQFGLVAVVTLVWRFRAIPGAVLAPLPVAVDTTLVAASIPASGMRTALAGWREPRTLLIGVIVMGAALSEGSANNWLSLAVVDGFAQKEAVAAMVFGVFVASMTTARLLGTWAIDRFGRVAVLAGSGTASVLGLGLFGLAPSLPTAVVGVVFWGLGAGLVVPIGMAAVSGDPLHAAGRVAVVSAFASIASMGAPPLIGLAAEQMGTRHALLLILVVMLAGTVLSGVAREETGPRARVATGGSVGDVPADDAAAPAELPAAPGLVSEAPAAVPGVPSQDRRALAVGGAR